MLAQEYLLTHDSHRAFAFAKMEIDQFHDPRMSAVHVFLGLLQGDDATAELLREPMRSQGLTLVGVRVAARKVIGEQNGSVVDTLERILQLADAAARRRHSAGIGTIDLLAVLLGNELRRSGVRTMLANLHIDAVQLAFYVGAQAALPFDRSKAEKLIQQIQEVTDDPRIASYVSELENEVCRR